MASSGLPVLGYQTPPPATGFACAPKWVVMLVAILVPGLPSALIRGARGLVTMASLYLTVGIAFVFFGPFWGEILFRNSPLKEAGLYPFLATCVAIDLTSVALAVRDRRQRLGPRH